MYFGMRCSTKRAEVMMPSQPSFWIPGNPARNLSVTSLPSPVLRNCDPRISSVSSRLSFLPVSSKVRMRNLATSTSWILPMLWSRRSISIHSALGVTIFHEARLSSAVPHKTAFLPPAFMATLPPMQLASALVGSQAHTAPAISAASIARLVTTPASQRMVATGSVNPGRVIRSTTPRASSFSVLITAERLVSGIAPPV